MGLKSISVIIPVKPGGRVRALNGLRSVEYPPDLYEVIVSEGCWPSRQRNLAVRQAQGDVLCFLDDDSLVSPQHFSRMVGWYSDEKVAAVGGPSLTPPDDSVWQHAFGCALASLFGGGGVRNRYRKSGAPRATGDNELILCNLGFRRDVFLDAGGLDERLYPNEENELMDRLQVEGYRLLHDPELAILRSQRPTFRAFVRQLFGYGRGRAEQTRITGSVGIMSLAPSLFLVYLCLVPLVRKPVYSIPLLCYVLLTLVFALYEGVQSGRPSCIVRLLAVFPALHLSYGAGVLAGLVRPRFRTAPAQSPEVTISLVKEMGKPWI
jgi:hypothetical protein